MAAGRQPEPIGLQAELARFYTELLASIGHPLPADSAESEE